MSQLILYNATHFCSTVDMKMLACRLLTVRHLTACEVKGQILTGKSVAIITETQTLLSIYQLTITVLVLTTTL